MTRSEALWLAAEAQEQARRPSDRMELAIRKILGENILRVPRVPRISQPHLKPPSKVMKLTGHARVNIGSILASNLSASAASRGLVGGS